LPFRFSLSRPLALAATLTRSGDHTNRFAGAAKFFTGGMCGVGERRGVSPPPRRAPGVCCCGALVSAACPVGPCAETNGTLPP
jgi:hypothetical protein